MKVTTKELLTKNYDVADISLHYSIVEGKTNKSGTFLLYTYDDVNNVLFVDSFNNYYTLCATLSMTAIEDSEKYEFLKEINKFKDEWKLCGQELISDDDLIAIMENYEQGYQEDETIDDGTASYIDTNGVVYQFTQGEDGITCQIENYGDEPKIGTFTDVENLCYSIAPIIQDGINNDDDVITLAKLIYEKLECDETLQDISEYLMK